MSSESSRGWRTRYRVLARRPRVVVCGVDIDGPDRAAKVIGRLFRNAGVDLVEMAAPSRAELIVRTAIDEGADAVALLLRPGTDIASVSLIIRLLRDKANGNVSVAVAGTLAPTGAARLHQLGVSAVLTSASAVEQFATTLRCEAEHRPGELCREGSHGHGA